MPHVHFMTPTGPVNMHYNISTPTSPSSPTITPHLPCIIFLHAGYVGQEVFESQFSDPQLRRQFNLIGLDMRAFGTTQGLVGKDTYNPADSADDIYRFMRALNLPPVHIFGISIGTCVATEIAIAQPDQVLSLTLCSPLPPTEPEDVAAGRLEVYHYWAHAFNHGGSSESPLTVDQAVLEDVLHGAQQLCFNNQNNRLTEAMSKSAMLQAMKNRAGSPVKLAESYNVSIAWFLNRKPPPPSSLAKISCPIRLIHCSDDVAYPLRQARELKAQLRQAGIADVALCQVSGPHYGNVVNPQEINPILRDVVLKVSATRNTSSSRRIQPLPHDHHPKMMTPFTKKLAKYGYDPHEDGSDSE